MPYTRDQIYAAMRKADAAGDANAVRALAAELKGMDATPAPAPAPAPKDDSFLHGVELGALKPIDNLVTWVSKIPGVSALDAFIAKRTGLPTADQAVRQNNTARANNTSAAGQFVGNVLGTAVAARVPGGIVPQSAAASAMLTDRPNDPVQVAKDAAIGAAAGKVLKVAAPYAKKAARAVTRALTPAERAAQNATGRAVVDAGNQAGVRVLTTDVKPPRTFIGKSAQSIGEKIPLAGTGGTRAAQQGERVEAVKSLLRDFGGEDTADLFDTSPTAVEDVARSLNDQRAADLTKYTGIKKAVIGKFAQAGAVPVDNTLQAIDAQIAELTQRGTEPALEVAKQLTSLRQAVQGKTLDQLEAIRADELSNAFSGGNTPADIRTVGEKALRSIYDPLRKDMGGFIEQQGGPLARTAWQNANAKLSAMAGDLQSAAFKNVLKNSDLTPEGVGRLLFSKNRSDVARLYSNLDAQGKARAQAAVLQRAFDKSISADQGLSVERFANNVKQMGDSVGVVFQGDDLGRVQGLVKLLDATRRAAAAAAAPATGVQNVPIFGSYALGSLFGHAAIPVAAIGGLLSRAYESAPVRNAFIRLGKAEAGSAEETSAANNLAKLLTAQMATKVVRHAANENAPAMLAASPGQGNEQQSAQ